MEGGSNIGKSPTGPPKRTTTRNKSEAQLTNKAFGLADLVRQARLLDTTAQAQSWGVLGGLGGYAVGRILSVTYRGLPFGPWEMTAGGIAIAMASYTIVVRSILFTNLQLLALKMMYATERISDVEYQAMRTKCLKDAGLL